MLNSALLHCTLVLSTLIAVESIDDSFVTTPGYEESGHPSGDSISMKIVPGTNYSPTREQLDNAVELIDTSNPVHGRLVKKLLAKQTLDKNGRVAFTLKDLEHVRQASAKETNDDVRAAVLMSKPAEHPDPVKDAEHSMAGPVPKLQVSDLMLPEPKNDKVIDPAVRTPNDKVIAPAVHTSNDKVIDPAVRIPNKETPKSANNAPVITTVNAVPTSEKIDSTEIDPCIICDCKQSNVLLSCNRRNLRNNYTSVLNSKLLQYKFSTVCLSNNDIDRLVPFPKLEQITRLCLSNNIIKNIDDGVFKKLSNLVYLDLSSNKMNSYVLTPNVFQGNYAPDYYEPLKSLKILNLSHNNFHSLNSDLFEHLPNLEELYLNSNPLTVIDLSTSVALASISYLKVLDLSETELSSIPNHLLHTPRFLHTLNLSFNAFKEVPEQLAQSHELQVLNMNGNPISVIKSFPVLPKLHTLHLSAMPELISLQANSLSNLGALQEFNCANNSKLNFIHWSTFSKTVLSDDGQVRTTVWSPLEKLVLSNNALQRIDGTLVARWDKLKVLDIRFNPWLCDCENQWLVSSLLPLLEANHPQYLNGLKCRDPIEMRNINLLDLDHKNYHMRCLDVYNNRPEYDGVILFVVLLVLLLCIPLCINVVLYLRKRSHSPAQCPNVHYSRAFYKPARTSDASDVISTHYIL